MSQKNSDLSSASTSTHGDLLRGIVVLLERGLGVEARILSRPLLDSASLLQYLADDPTQFGLRARHWQAEMIRDDLAMMKHMAELGLQPDETRRAEAEGKLQSIVGNNIECIAPFPKLRERLRIIGRPRRYLEYKQASGPAHASLSALSSRAQYGPDHTVLGVRSKFSTNLAVAASTIESFGDVILCTGHLMDWPPEAEQPILDACTKAHEAARAAVWEFFPDPPTTAERDQILPSDRSPSATEGETPRR